MYSATELAIKFLSHYFSARNGKGHGIHSPFVFEFITKVLNDKTVYDDYKKVEALREKLLHDHTNLKVDDLGAGSVSDNSTLRSISSITKQAVKPKKQSQLLYRVVKFYKPGMIVELGTSLGLTTSYFSLANPDAKIFTLEGSKTIAQIADQNFKTLKLQNIMLIEGNFDNTLPAVLYQTPTVDLVFIDGNHRQEPTENYFHWLLSKVHNDTILIFDDIHWSKEMEQAWKNIQSHLAVRCSIDLFYFGIVLFRQEFRERQQFKIRW
jgi:predicted O-methyltransferase YrrM